MKKVLSAVLITLFMILPFSTILTACNNNNAANGYTPFLEEKDNSIKIGISGSHYWSFKNDNGWINDGVYVYDKKSDVKVFTFENGEMFRFTELQYNAQNPGTVIDNSIDSVKVVKNEENYKEIRLSNSQVSMTLAAKDNDYIERIVTINSTVNNKLSDFQMAFSLRSIDELFYMEYGAIATKDPIETQAQLPYAFPALYSQLTNEKLNVNVVNVVDYTFTSSVFHNLRRRKVSDCYEIGVNSSANDISKDQQLVYRDFLKIENKASDFYELIGSAADKYLKVNPIPVSIGANGNMNASSFRDITGGLYNDLMDTRTGTKRFLGAMTAYGYLEEQNGGWGESFALLDVLKGMIRYSQYTKNQDIIDSVIEMAKVLVEPQNGKSWIGKYNGENAAEDDFFLNHTYVNGFGVNSSGEETGSVPGISTWKYYDMIANLAEISLHSDSQELKDGFLKLMPFFNKLRLEDYSQPVAWYYSNRTPATGFENGGSGGGASLWAYVHLLASEISNDSALKKLYLEDAKKSLEHANSLDYFQMHAMRVAVKPVAIGWNVKANVLATKLTGDAKYLTHAQKISKSILSFYYLNSNPYTYFASYAFGYADLRERWEAYFEMATSLWLIVDVMESMPYDNTLLDIYYAASKTHQMAFPINGEPYGSYNRSGAYDSLDGHYIPFEFATGVTGDNPGGEGGTQAALRQIKEIYGSGETFLEYLMYEAWGTSVDNSLLTLCLTGAGTRYDDENHKFILYNPDTVKKTSVFRFTNFAEGSYQVKAEGKVVGVFNDNQLESGITFILNDRTSILVSILKTA